MPRIPSPKKRAVAEKWLELIFQTYPAGSAQFLLRQDDPFRNPVGQAFREAVPWLAAELFGEMDAGKVAQALEGIVRIRAVQDFSPSRAVSFVFLLKKILQEEIPVGSEDGILLNQRVDEMALAAFDLFMRYREQLYEVRLAEARRRVGLLEKIYAASEEDRP